MYCLSQPLDIHSTVFYCTIPDLSQYNQTRVHGGIKYAYMGIYLIVHKKKSTSHLLVVLTGGQRRTISSDSVYGATTGHAMGFSSQTL